MATSSDYDYPIDVNNIRILQCLPVHQSDVTCCDFAIGNDFIYVITGSSDKLVRLWEWIIGDGFVETSFSPLSSHKYGVTSLQVSPQSSMLITGSIDGVAFLWRIKTGEKIYAFVQDNGDPIRVCRFSPNSVMVVTAGDNGAVCIWDLIHRSLIRTITQHEGIVQAISFTSDSLYLLTSCTLGVMNFWSVDSLCDTTIEESLPLITIGDAHDLGVLSCDFSPIVTIQEDNIQKRMYSLATSGNDHCIKIWKITAEVLPKQLNAFSEINFELTDFLDGHSSAITYVKYNIDGNYIASTSLDRTCRVWGLNENRDVAVLEGHSRYVNCCGFSQNNIFLATGSNDKSVIIWDLTGCTTFDSEFTNTLQLLNFKANLQENAVAKLGENHDNDVILLQQIENVHSISINCCDINRNDLTLVTASSDKTIKLFKFNSDENLYEEVEYSPLCEHTYSVNYVEFSKTNEYLVSCSLDGSAIIWNYLTGEQIFKPTFADEVCGIRTCRLSYDCKILVTAGDDERATVFDLENMESLAILEGHSDAITSIALTKNTKLLATVCSAGDLRLWSLESLSDSVETEPICVQLEAHDLGVQNCDFSENEMPIPNVNYTESQYYLLATCGNDSMVKLWKIKLPIIDESILDYGNVEVIEWRCLIGHGGNVNFVRFSPHNSDIVCSVATDRQARIWSPYSSVCLYTLDHESMLTSCAFSSDCSMIAISCLNKSIWIWKLPQKLVFQNILMNRIKNNKKSILNWTTNEVVLWIRSIDLGNLADTIIECNINGEILLNTDEDELSNTLNLDEDSKEIFLPQLAKLKSKQNIMDEKVSIPHEFLCPITQEVMRNPMKCTDGFTYEQSAIEEWFSSGKNTSPMTNEELEDMELTPNYELLIGIEAFINSN